MRKLIALTVVAATALTLAASAMAATRTVRTGDNWYVRPRGVPTVNARAGDTIRWRNVGDQPHNAVVRRGPSRWRPRVFRPGQTFSQRVRRGTYVIYCSIHGLRDQRMRLRVR